MSVDLGAARLTPDHYALQADLPDQRGDGSNKLRHWVLTGRCR